jgi:hypothetical protein
MSNKFCIGSVEILDQLYWPAALRTLGQYSDLLSWFYTDFIIFTWYLNSRLQCHCACLVETVNNFQYAFNRILLTFIQQGITFWPRIDSRSAVLARGLTGLGRIQLTSNLYQGQYRNNQLIKL